MKSKPKPRLPGVRAGRSYALAFMRDIGMDTDYCSCFNEGYHGPGHSASCAYWSARNEYKLIVGHYPRKDEVIK